MNESSAQKRYLRKLRSRRRQTALLRISVFAGFLLLWEAAARLGWIDSFIFSSPSDLVRTFHTMLLDQSLLSHIGITLAETLLSFLLVTGISAAAAVLLWLFPRFAEVSSPIW